LLSGDIGLNFDKFVRPSRCRFAINILTIAVFGFTFADSKISSGNYCKLY